MVVFWSFQCDQNHLWEAVAQDSADPGPDLGQCPIDGSQAVTVARQDPADRVRVEFVPAARLVDPVKGTVGHDSDYYLEIVSIDGVTRLRSARSYSWEQVVQKASLFCRVPWSDALRRWKRLGLDRSPEHRRGDSQV